MPILGAATASSQTGIYVPSDWGSTWKPKRATSGSSLIRVGMVGDSVGQGYWTSSPNTKGWWALLRNALQTAYGDGGSGIQTAAWSSTYFSNIITPTLPSTYTSQFWTMTGSWTCNNVAGQVSGSGAALIYTSSGNGATASIPGIRGTIVKLRYASAATTMSTFTVSIDGTVVDTITPTGTVIVEKSYTVSAGTHTVLITGTSTGTILLNSAGGYNATGVVVDNYSTASLQSTNYAGTAATYGNPRDWSGGQYAPCDLMLYSLGVNDAQAGSSDVTWADNARKFLDGIRDYGTGSGNGPDIVFVLPHVGKWESSTHSWHRFATQARGMAEAYGAALVDLWALYRNSYDAFANVSGWSGGYVVGTPGSAGTDGVHPGDAGHQLYYNKITAAVPGILA